MKYGAIIVVLMLCVLPLNVYSQSTFNQSFPAVDSGNYFIWDTNTTKVSNSSFSIAQTIECRGEEITIDSVRETADFIEINVTSQYWKYIDGTKSNVTTTKLTLRILSSAIEDTNQLFSRFFRVSDLNEAFRSYIEGLSGFFIKNNTNFTMLIEEGYFEYNGQNRSVLIGLLEGYTAKNEWTHAKYIVDKEYGVLLAREFIRIKYESSNFTTMQLPIEKEIMLLRDTNLFTLSKQSTLLDLMVLITILAVMIALVIIIGFKYGRSKNVG